MKPSGRLPIYRAGRLTVNSSLRYDLRFADDDGSDDQVASASYNSYGCHGYPEFIRRSVFERSRYLKDDVFTIRCDMTVVKFRADDAFRVVFEVGGETLAAHRWLLAVRSPVFNAELFGQMQKSSTGVVRIDDMEVDVFKALLCFVYTDMLPEEFVMSQHLLVASDKYNLERLKSICEHNLCKRIEASNVTFLLELAEQHRCHGLKNACFEFLSTPVHLDAALTTDSFKHLSRNCPSIMMELIAKLGTYVQHM